MISSKFSKSFGGARDLVVFYEFLCDFFLFFWDFQKFTNHHRVTSTPETLRKLTWNDLTVFWLNFDKNRRFLFCTVQPLAISYSQTFMGNNIPNLTGQNHRPTAVIHHSAKNTKIKLKIPYSPQSMAKLGILNFEKILVFYCKTRFPIVPPAARVNGILTKSFETRISSLKKTSPDSAWMILDIIG